jgi:hypothetical protein
MEELTLGRKEKEVPEFSRDSERDGEYKRAKRRRENDKKHHKGYYDDDDDNYDEDDYK